MRSLLVFNISCLVLAISACGKEEPHPGIEVYGHAGTSIYPERSVFPPNTRESVCYALDVLGADGVEVDIQMTKDSVLVLYHEPYLEQATRLSGCIPGYNYGELENTTVYGSSCVMIRLEEALAICTDRGKGLFLDLKPYHYCDTSEISYAVFDRALNRALLPYSAEQKSRIIINTRQDALLPFISDSLLTRSFETENLEKGLQLVENGVTHELCIRFDAMTETLRAALADAEVRYSIFGVKTQADIRSAVGFSPERIITDNIAYTCKKVK